jgi:hypothetical protein
MSTLLFSRSRQEIALIRPNGLVACIYPAANNVDSHAKGPWPHGTFEFSWFQSHAGDNPSAAYGSHGIFIFEVPGREGLGLHAGREGVADGLGRIGYLHCTLGCIRTVEGAMGAFLIEHAIDPITGITVIE